MKPSSTLVWLVLAATAMPACSRPSTTAPEPPGSAAGIVSASAATRPRAASRTARLAEASATRDILNALSDDCLSCAETNGCLDSAQQGGLCETVTGHAKPSGRSEVSLCLEALRCVFTSKCANSGQQNECLCGKTDVLACMDGKAPPSGTCVAVYKDDFGNDGKTMYSQFINPTYGAGRANAIIQCVIPMCPTCRIP
jgi:hypothetical protein